jgi:NADH-quinone oxidoreductase subunit J
MNAVFYISGGIALLASLAVVTSRHAVHAALYLVVSLLAVAVVFFAQGAAFVAALEVIIYAGAIMVMILFAIMLLDLGRAARRRSEWFRPSAWLGPLVLMAVLAIELGWLLIAGTPATGTGEAVTVRQVALALYGPYMLAVELSSMLLLAGLVGAYHLSARDGEPGS